MLQERKLFLDHTTMCITERLPRDFLQGESTDYFLTVYSNTHTTLLLYQGGTSKQLLAIFGYQCVMTS